MSCQTQPLAAAAFSDDKRVVSLHRYRSVRFSSESRGSRTPNDSEKRENTGAISLTSLVAPPAAAACDDAMTKSAPPNTSFDVDDPPPPPACRFPKLEECAHFHYERVALGGISVTLAGEQSEHDQEGWVCLEVRSHVSSPPEGSTSGGVGGIEGEKTEAGGADAPWTLFRNAENFLRLDDLLHRCIYDRKVSCLPNLADKFTPELLGDRWRYRQLVAAYVHHLSIIADDAVNCGPVLYWLQMDNKGHKLLVSREDSSSINTPAVAAAYSVRKYTSTARDEISFDVGDMISVIDMPGPSESVWWRGKRGFRVGFFPHACVAVIGDKVPRHLPQPPPIVHSVAVAPIAPVLRKHGKLISLFRSFILSRPPRRALRQRGILRPRVFGCDLGELLLHSGGAVPEVLSACAKAIEERGAVDGIYRLSGGAGLTQRLRAAFDAGAAPALDAALLARDPHAVASLLKMYFRELPNPLCTYQLYEPLVQAVAGTGPGGTGGNAGAAGSNGGNGGATAGAMTSEESVAQRLRAVRAVLVKLPPPHYRTLAFLARHLLRVSLLHEQTGMTARNMAIVWAPNLLRCPRPQHALQGVAVQAVVTEFLICYAEELFAEDQSMETDADTGAQDQSEQVELRGMEASKRPKSLPVHPPTKLLSLEEARRRAPGASPQPLTSLRPASHHTPNYIEVGSGPNNLPQYHTVIDLPTPGRARGKSTPGGWRRLFSRNSRNKATRPAPPVPLPPAATNEEAMDESVPGVRAARSYESLCEAEVAPAAPAPRPPAMHARSSSCDSYFEGWQQELLEMRLRLAPQEQRTDMFHEVMEDSAGSSPGESQACSVEPSPRKLSDVDPAPSDRPSLEEQLAGIGYIDVESPRVAPRPGKRVCKDHDSPTNSMSDFQAAVAAVKLRERGSPRKTKPSARYSGMHRPVTLTDDKLTAVNSRLSWHGREGHSTLIKIDWPVENTSPSNLTASTLNSGPITPVTPVYDILESDSEVSEANKQTIKVETKDCQNCDREKCLQCELKAADCDNLKIEDYTEQNIQDSLEHSPVHSTEISYQNLNRLSTSSNSEPNSDRKRDHSYENCEAMKLMTSSHESSSSYSNASFTKQSDDYECCRKRPNYINLQSSSTSKSSPGSPLKSPLKSTISITFRSPTKSTSEYDNIETPTNERDSLYEDIDLEKNLSIVEEAPVPEADASLPTQQACQPADFSQDLIILEPPNEDDVDVYSQVKFLRRSIQEVNAMILESPEKEEKEEVTSDNERNIYENVNFDEKSYENINVDALGVCDKHVELNAASVDNICEAVNNKVIENSSEPLANQNLEKDNGNVVKQKVVSTNLNVRELANRFESPTEQKPQFNFDKTRPEPKCNQEHKEEEKKCLEIVNKVQSEKPNSPKTYKLDKTSTNTRSLDENAFIKEFGSTTETDRRKSLEVKDFKKRAKYLPDLNLNLEETETKVESVTPTTENKISLIQRFNDMIKPDLKTLIDSDTEKKLSRERIEKYKEERRNFLREKYSSQSFRSNPEQLTRIKLKKDSTEAIDVDDKEELQKFERRNTVDSGQRLRFSLARSANNLDAIQSPLGTKQECFPISVADAGVAKELDRKDKPPSYHIRDMAAMFEQKSLNSP